MHFALQGGGAVGCNEKWEIRNGKIIGVMEKEKIPALCFPQRVKLLLAGQGEGRRAHRRSRFFKPVIGGDYQGWL